MQFHFDFVRLKRELFAFRSLHGALTKTVLVMQLTAILLLAAVFQVSATGTAQTVTYTGKAKPLTKVLSVIKEQTGYAFFYRKADVKDSKPVTVSLNNADVKAALDEVLKNQRLTYEIQGNTVLISVKSEEEKPSVEKILEQSPPISGIIRDADGNPIAGVNVVVKGTKRGVVTDAQGKFSIDAAVNEVLVISSIGYNARELRIESTNIPHVIALDKSVSQLDEVQYIAYGKTSQRFSVGPVYTVKAENIEKQPVNNPFLTLQGRVPGLVVTQANGIPGGGITVRIQGRNNLDNSNVRSDPFIVIDGVPYPSQNLNTFKGGGDEPILGSSSNDGSGSADNFGNPLAYINTADIESITILRDADATAIYGSRAANGAILITTKRGRTGKIRTDFNLQQGWGSVPKKMDLLSSQQYMEMRWEAIQNDGEPVNETDYDLRGVWDTTRYTDWQKELIGGTAQFTRLSAGVSGGSSNVQYLISTTYGRETTVFPGNSANKFGALHFNFSVASPNQRLKVQLGANYMASSNKLPATDYTSYALNLPPVAPPLYNPDGSLNWAPDPETNMSTWYNPLMREYRPFETTAHNLVSNGSISYTILPGLDIKSSFGYNSLTSNQFVTALDESEKPEYRAGRFRTANFSFNTSRSWIIEPQLTWQQKWGSHSLTTLVGVTFQSQKNDGKGINAFGHINDVLLKNIYGGLGVSNGGYDYAEYKYNAIFGRINYMFHERYLLNLSARRDGSSRFGSQSQFHNFGSVGIGWIMSEESLFKRSLPFISYAKLRGNYGTTGNDQIGDYRFMNLYRASANGIQYQGTGGTIIAAALPNPFLEWEETRKFQAGIDLGIFKDRWLFTVNYYRNRTSNNFTIYNMPFVTGFPTYLENLPALIQNTGWEFVLSTNDISIGNVRWNSNINLTIPRNELVEFPGIENSPLRNVLEIGAPLGSYKVVPYFGVEPTAGIYMLKNRNGEATVTPEVADRTVLINTDPKYYGGFQNSFTCNGFTLDFLIQFTQKKSMNIFQLLSFPGRLYVDDPYYIAGNQPSFVLDRWQKIGETRTYQRFSSTGAGLGPYPSDFSYRNGAFVRLKNVSFSYQIPAELLRKFRMQQMRISVNAQNLFTITRYNGLDPETLNENSLPPLRMIAASIQVML